MRHFARANDPNSYQGQGQSPPKVKKTDLLRGNDLDLGGLGRGESLTLTWEGALVGGQRL